MRPAASYAILRDHAETEESTLGNFRDRTRHGRSPVERLLGGRVPCSYSARFNASRLRNSPAVRDRVDELLTEFGERSQIKAEYLQHQLLPLVEATSRDLYEMVKGVDGKTSYRLRPLAELPPRLAAAVQRIKLDPESGAVTEIALYSKVDAGNTLLRAVGAIKGNDVKVLMAVLEKKVSELTDDELASLETRLIALADRQPELIEGIEPHGN
jgi:hypothetical protein